jgi:hypothetical protein
MSMERRHHVRQPVTLAVNVMTAKHRQLGVTRDLSTTGVLFHSLGRFSIGEHVRLVFRTLDKKRVVSGRVVRIDSDTHSVFKHITAVEFDSPIAAPT